MILVGMLRVYNSKEPEYCKRWVCGCAAKKSSLIFYHLSSRISPYFLNSGSDMGCLFPFYHSLRIVKFALEFIDRRVKTKNLV